MIQIPPSCRIIVYTYFNMNFNFRYISNLSTKERKLVQSVKDLVKNIQDHGNLVIQIVDTPKSLDNLIYLQTFSYKYTLNKAYEEKDCIGIYYEYFIQSLPKYIGEGITLNIKRPWSYYDSVFYSIHNWENFHRIELKKDVIQISFSFFPNQIAKNFFFKAQVLELNRVTLNIKAKQLLESLEKFKKTGDIQKQVEIKAELTQTNDNYDIYKFEKVILIECTIIDPKEINLFKNTKVLKLVNSLTHIFVKQEIQKLQNLVKYQHIVTKNLLTEEHQLLQKGHFDYTENLLKLQNVQSFTFTLSTDDCRQNIMNTIKQVNRKIQKLQMLIINQVDLNQILEVCRCSNQISKYVLIITKLKIEYQSTSNDRISKPKFDNFGFDLQNYVQDQLGSDEASVQIYQDTTSKQKDQKIKLNILINQIKDRNSFESQIIDIRFQDYMDLKSELNLNLNLK